MAEAVLYECKNHVGYIRLNRPENGNRIDLELAQELGEICTRINQDEEVYLAVISAAGAVFCLGGDLPDKSGWDSPASPAEALAGLDCPLIAALNGDVLGPGLELALACDIRFAASTARFGLPQVTQGLLPTDGGTQRLPRIVGKGKALEMVLTGEIIDAQTALEIGLVNRVVDGPDFSAWIESEAGKMAAKAPLAMRYVKEAVNQGLDLTLAQGLRLEADLYFLLHTTEDRTEGIRSFLQKRPPQYKGK
jgi:enoyl-CoA hydratase/carnithine racemase